MEGCPNLPEPLKHVRRLAYSRYGGLQKIQFSKVAVLKNPPKVKQMGDSDPGNFLKQYRDCGIRMSERGIKEVTVTNFLSKEHHHTRIIYGQPGIGKTTFLKHLCQKVASNEPNEFSLVLFFPLRVKLVSQALQDNSSPYKSSLENLLHYYVPDESCSDVAQVLLRSQGEGVLMIFDGADEVCTLMGSPEGSLLQFLLEDRLLPKAHFIVTTRPGGCPLLQDHSTLFYEILGFDEDAIESYVKDHFKNEPDKGEAMLSTLRARPDLMGGAYIPKNLVIFCSLPEQNSSEIPSTMTKCCKSYIAKSITREKREKVNKAYQMDPSLTHLPHDVKDHLLSLGALAFDGLSKDPSSYIFQEADVCRIFSAPPNLAIDRLCSLGLLHQHASQAPGYCTHTTLNFSHTIEQEYFAAYRLSHLPVDEQVAFWSKNRQNPKYAVVLRFFAGLTQFESAKVTEAILPEVAAGDLPSKCDNYHPQLLYLCHTLFEAQNELVTKNIASQLNSDLTFNLFLTPFDTMVVHHCLSKYQCLAKLEFCNHFLLPQSFHHVCSVVQSNPQLQSLKLGLTQFSAGGEYL